MRHGRKTVKLQRPAAHKRALLSNLVCSLIRHKQIRTTLAKAKAVRPFAERMVTLGKRGDIHARRIATSYLHNDDAVKELFETIAPAAAGRQGGYTRIIKLGPRHSDSAPMAFIEWVDQAGSAGAAAVTEEPKEAAKPAAKRKSAARKAPKKAEEPSDGESQEG